MRTEPRRFPSALRPPRRGPLAGLALSAVASGLAIASAAPAAAAPAGALSTTTTAHNNVQVGREGGVVTTVRLTSSGTDPLTVTVPNSFAGRVCQQPIAANQPCNVVQPTNVAIQFVP